MKKLKEELTVGDEISVKDFKDFYIPEIKSVKIYHNTVESFKTHIYNFMKVKLVANNLMFITRSGETEIDLRKLQPLGLVTDFGSIIFISRDGKVTFEIFITE